MLLLIIKLKNKLKKMRNKINKQNFILIFEKVIIYLSYILN